MENAAVKLYEAMFLIDSAEAARDWDGVLNNITTILQRAGAEIISTRKWDERPLAYKIGKCVRGTYILSYFRVSGLKITEIERDVRLSERILRVLILRGEHLTEADMAKDTPAMRAARGITEGVPAAAEEGEPAATTAEVSATDAENPVVEAERQADEPDQSRSE